MSGNTFCLFFFLSAFYLSAGIVESKWKPLDVSCDEHQDGSSSNANSILFDQSTVMKYFPHLNEWITSSDAVSVIFIHLNISSVVYFQIDCFNGRCLFSFCGLRIARAAPRRICVDPWRLSTAKMSSCWVFLTVMACLFPVEQHPSTVAVTRFRGAKAIDFVKHIPQVLYRSRIHCCHGIALFFLLCFNR